jgi:hypothetical protein
MNTAYDYEAYEAHIEQRRAEDTAEYDQATDAYVQAVECYENTLGKPTWVEMDSRRYGVGNAVQVMLIEHTKNPDYYVAYYLTPAGYICIHRHITLDMWENMCSEKPAPDWFIKDAEHIRLQTLEAEERRRVDEEKARIEWEKRVREGLLNMLARGVTWGEIEKNVRAKTNKTFCPKELTDENGRPTVYLTLGEAMQIVGN